MLFAPSLLSACVTVSQHTSDDSLALVRTKQSHAGASGEFLFVVWKTNDELVLIIYIILND